MTQCSFVDTTVPAAIQIEWKENVLFFATAGLTAQLCQVSWPGLVVP
jgi:hypothetical protein